MEPLETSTGTAGFPELTLLGKRIEMLRISRGLSKQHLARHAGTSRQQLWRVMTGKSELTSTLRLRLADALDVDGADLDRGRDVGTTTNTRLALTSFAARMAAPTSPFSAPSARDIEDYIRTPAAVAITLASMPAGPAGRALKRRYLDSLEDIALEAGLPLAAELFELRRRVLAGEL